MKLAIVTRLNAIKDCHAVRVTLRDHIFFHNHANR